MCHDSIRNEVPQFNMSFGYVSWTVMGAERIRVQEKIFTMNESMSSITLSSQWISIYYATLLNTL